MKVLHIINSLGNGGAERLLVDILPIINSSGYNCSVLTLNDSSNNINFKLLQDNEVPIFCLKAKNIYNPFLILKLKKYIKSYDLIHVHLFPCQYWVALATALIKKEKRPIIITTEHSTYNRRREIVLFKYLDKFIYLKYHKIICISKSTEDSLANFTKIFRDKFITINNGVDLSRFESICDEDLRLNFDSSKTIITHIAGFRKEKDQDTLIKSLQELPENFVVLFAGLGERLDECKTLVEKLGLNNRVQFLGYVENVPLLLDKSDFVVMSSHFEGFGLAAVEGMASGKPVLASNVPGLREVVKDYGILFEKGDYINLAKLILQLDQDISMYNEISFKCKERANDYSIIAMTNQLINLYNDYNS